MLQGVPLKHPFLGSFYGGEKTLKCLKRVLVPFSHLFKNEQIGWSVFASKNLHWVQQERKILWVRKHVPETLLWLDSWVLGFLDSWVHLNALFHVHLFRIHGTGEASIQPQDL